MKTKDFQLHLPHELRGCAICFFKVPSNMNQEDIFKKIIAHCKEYGFIFPSSEIYDGLSAVYDYGQNGVELKNNIRN
jgi:hypothetical protein